MLEYTPVSYTHLDVYKRQEESFGTGSNHIREKDGLWAIVAWLNILAIYHKRNPENEASIKTIQDEFWNEYGRTFFTRYDYEHIECEQAEKVVALLNEFVSKPEVCGSRFPGDESLTVIDCGDFSYRDLDGSISEKQGLFVKLSNGAKFVLRLSGTGSSGATIRLYIEKYTDNKDDYDQTADVFLKPVINSIVKFLKFKNILGTEEPTVRT